MSIVIIRQDDKIDVWKKAVQHADPNIKIYGYREIHPKEEITMALVWKQPKESLSVYPKLKCIASTGAGVDFIMNDNTIPLHLPITRVIDPMLASDMSEHVLALIFAFLKNQNDYRHNQKNKIWEPKPYHRIKDFTIGVLGLGELGKKVAIDLVRFGFRVQGWSQSIKKIEKVWTFAGSGELSSFLSTSEILVCLLPLTNQTEGILNAQLFSQLPKGSYIINVARGGHLVDGDLLNMLDVGHLSGAALDVFHQEPLAMNHPFWHHPKVQITPHCASVSNTESVVPQVLENYRRLCEARPLRNVVSRARGY